MKDVNAQIQHLHACFCAATGFQLRLGLCDYAREFAWHSFIKAGFTEEDIALWASYLHRKIREGTRNPGALKFTNSIARLDVFEEDLNMARAEKRIKQPTARDRILQQARPTVAQVTPQQTQNTAKPVSELIANLKRAAGM